MNAWYHACDIYILYNDLLQRIYYWYSDHLRIDLGFNIDMIMMERFASLVELLPQMMIERFASLVELFAYIGSMDSFFLELKHLMIACFDCRFVAFHHGRMVFFNDRTTESDDVGIVCLM